MLQDQVVKNITKSHMRRRCPPDKGAKHWGHRVSLTQLAALGICCPGLGSSRFDSMSTQVHCTFCLNRVTRKETSDQLLRYDHMKDGGLRDRIPASLTPGWTDRMWFTAQGENVIVISESFCNNQRGWWPTQNGIWKGLQQLNHTIHKCKQHLKETGTGTYRCKDRGMRDRSTWAQQSSCRR